MNFGVYTRKSVFSDKSDSIESQMNMCKDYIHNNFRDKISTIVEYEDEGYTGSDTKRPGYKSLMEDIGNKKIDVLVCYKIDRISRNVLDFSKTFNTLLEHGVQFVSVKEQIDTSTPLGRAMMYICSVFAQMERETIAERVKDSMIGLAKSGKWAGGKPPIGYKLEKKAINGKQHTVLAINDKELPFLNMVYDTFLSGYSLSGLETYFRNSNVKTLNGNYLSCTQLYSILKNPHYVAATTDIYDYFKNLGCIMATERDKFDGKKGLLVYGRTSGGKKKFHKVNTPDKWLVSIGLHEPIMNADKWISVQKRFGLNLIDKTRKHEAGILKGILKCKCGYTMVVKHKVDKTYSKTYNHYTCQNRTRRGVEYCDMKAVNVDEIDAELMDTLSQLSLNKEMVEAYMAENNVVSLPIKTKSDILRDISIVNKKITNITSVLHDNTGSTSAKYLIADIEKLDKQITTLNYELREIEINERNNEKAKIDISDIHSIICEYIKIFSSLGYDDKVKYLQEFLSACVWDGEKLKISIL